MSARYAIYFTLPETDPLYRLASAWLGYDAYTAQPLDFEPGDLALGLEPCRPYASGPARYGLHATLKAPFRLHPDKTLAQLMIALEAFAGKTPAFECAALSIQPLGDFLALQPLNPCDKLNFLARNCVQQFDAFRAPLNADEIRKRNPQQLSERQSHYLERWGYPYVLDEFQFHLTLTQSLSEDTLQQTRLSLEPLFRSALDKPLKVDRIHLFQQDNANAHFRIISSHHLKQRDTLGENSKRQQAGSLISNKDAGAYCWV